MLSLHTKIKSSSPGSVESVWNGIFGVVGHIEFPLIKNNSFQPHIPNFRACVYIIHNIYLKMMFSGSKEVTSKQFTSNVKLKFCKKSLIIWEFLTSNVEIRLNISSTFSKFALDLCKTPRGCFTKKLKASIFSTSRRIYHILLI